LGSIAVPGNRPRKIEDFLSARRIGKFCIRPAAVSKSAQPRRFKARLGLASEFLTRLPRDILKTAYLCFNRTVTGDTTNEVILFEPTGERRGAGLQCLRQDRIFASFVARTRLRPN
jgi:hypothetical protein